MTTRRGSLLTLVLLLVGSPGISSAQPYGKPDREQPGDAMIQAYLEHETTKIAARYADDVQSLADWQAKRPQYVEEYFYMLGLSPRPEETPLNATITGTLEGSG